MVKDDNSNLIKNDIKIIKGILIKLQSLESFCTYQMKEKEDLYTEAVKVISALEFWLKKGVNR